MADMDLSESTAGNARVVGVRGEVDLSTSERFSLTLQRLATEPGGPVIVDLTDCAFIDSSGLAAILHAAGRRDGFTIVSGSGPPADVLKMTGIDQTVPVYGTLDDALAAVPG